LAFLSFCGLRRRTKYDISFSDFLGRIIRAEHILSFKGVAEAMNSAQIEKIHAILNVRHDDETSYKSRLKSLYKEVGLNGENRKFLGIWYSPKLKALKMFFPTISKLCWTYLKKDNFNYKMIAISVFSNWVLGKDEELKKVIPLLYTRFNLDNEDIPVLLNPPEGEEFVSPKDIAQEKILIKNSKIEFADYDKKASEAYTQEVLEANKMTIDELIEHKIKNINEFAKAEEEAKKRQDNMIKEITVNKDEETRKEVKLKKNQKPNKLQEDVNLLVAQQQAKRAGVFSGMLDVVITNRSRGYQIAIDDKMYKTEYKCFLCAWAALLGFDDNLITAEHYVHDTVITPTFFTKLDVPDELESYKRINFIFIEIQKKLITNAAFRINNEDVLYTYDTREEILMQTSLYEKKTFSGTQQKMYILGLYHLAYDKRNPLYNSWFITFDGTQYASMIEEPILSYREHFNKINAHQAKLNIGKVETTLLKSVNVSNINNVVVSEEKVVLRKPYNVFNAEFFEDKEHHVTFYLMYSVFDGNKYKDFIVFHEGYNPIHTLFKHMSRAFFGYSNSIAKKKTKSPPLWMKVAQKFFEVNPENREKKERIYSNFQSIIHKEIKTQNPNVKVIGMKEFHDLLKKTHLKDNTFIPNKSSGDIKSIFDFGIPEEFHFANIEIEGVKEKGYWEEIERVHRGFNVMFDLTNTNKVELDHLKRMKEKEDFLLKHRMLTEK